MNIRLLTAVLSFALVVGGCTTAMPGANVSRDAKPPIELPGNGSDCVFGSVRDFTVLSDKALLLYTTARSHAYYVELRGGCYGLRTAFQIGFRDRDGRLCGYGIDSVVVSEDPFPESCPITGIYKLTDGQTDAVLEHYGRVKKSKKPKVVAEEEGSAT